MTIPHDTDEDVTKYLSGMSKREKWFHLELVARKVPTLVDSTFLESFRPGFKIGLLGIKIGFLGLKIGFQLVIKIELLGIKLGFLGLKIGFQLGFGVSLSSGVVRLFTFHCPCEPHYSGNCTNVGIFENGNWSEL